MPPNRKASLSDYHPCNSRFASFQTIVTAKDAPTSRPTVDELYWDWPSAAVSISTTDDVEELKTKNNNNSYNNMDLFSANHIVANLVRAASRLQIEEEKQADDHEEESSSSSHSLEYWNPHPHSEFPTTARILVEDRWTSGIAIESHLIRDSSLILTNQQQQPSSLDTNSTKSSSIANTSDAWWNWPSFPHTAMRFSHEHYQRQLSLLLSECTSSSLQTTLNTTTHQNDDYWHGM